MQTASYYRDKAERVHRLADAMTNDDDRKSLRQLAEDLTDIAKDIENHAIQVVAPENMPQLRHPR